MRTRLALSALVLFACCAHAFGNPSEDQYSVSARHYEQGRWEAAAVEFQSFLTRFSEDARGPSVRFFLGECYVQMRQYQAAYDVFRALKSEDAVRAYQSQIEFRIGETAYLMGDGQRAFPALQQFTNNHPDDAMCQYALPYLGDLALGRGDLELAKASYRDALKRFPEGPLHDECRFGLARAFEAASETEEALRFYSFLSEFKNKSLADDALLRMGVLTYEAEEPQKAITFLRRVVDDFPEGGLRAHALYWIGMSYVALNQDERAVDVFALAEAGSDDATLQPAALFYRGEALRTLGREAQAAEAYDGIIQRWGQTDYADDAFQARIQIAFDVRDGQLIEALVAEFTKQHGDSPLLPMAMHLGARSALRDERFEKADALFSYLVNDVHASEGSDSGLKLANLYYLALCKLARQDYDRCLAVFDELEAISSSEQPLTSGVYAARGSAMMGLGRHAEAVTQFEQYLEEEPEGTEAARAQSQMVLALAELQRHERVTAEHQKLIKQYPASDLIDTTTLSLAESAFQRNDFRVAEKYFQYLADHGQSPMAREQGLAGLGWSQLRQERETDAAKSFDQFRQEFPESNLSGDAEFVVAQARERQDDWDAALAAYEKVIEHHPDSRHHAQALFSAARACETLGRVDQALTLLEQLAQTHPNYTDLDAAWYQRAWLLRDAGRERDADAAFAKIYETFRGSEYWSDATYRLAEGANRGGEPQAAQSLLQELIKNGDDERVLCHGLYLSGQIATEQQNWAKVVLQMQRVVDAHGSSALAMNAEYWVAEAYFRLRQYPQALERFDALQPKLATAEKEWVAMVPLRRAQLNANAKRWQEAAEIAATMRENYPEFRQMFEVDYVLGRCLTSQARFAEARETLSRVVEHEVGRKTETAARAQWMIGETYFHQKQFDEAIRAYHRVEALYAYPIWQSLSLLQAGKCHEQLAQYDACSRLYGQVLREYPDTPAAKDAANRLQQLPRETTQNEAARAGNARHPASKQAVGRGIGDQISRTARNAFGVFQRKTPGGSEPTNVSNTQQR